MSKAEGNFESLLLAIHEAGIAWIEAQLKARQLEEDQKSFLAAIMNELEKQSTEKLSEAKLDRWARGANKYREYIMSMCVAVAEAQKLKVRYENLQMLLEARRSEHTMERAKIEKGIHYAGS